ncbi:S8 family serine peptidase [Hyalangium minutum]|uniref:Alkaline serine exoprotease A n=1 Tax=Hyalangium minutum TaxID=394096 RepID=A0A085WED9_9BACT|nr:S8 family serine peptidase [Hyalangium minutum]KFE66052.1 Alkaline serine exoprotease A precursor [Hyalangium minutum]
MYHRRAVVLLVFLALAACGGPELEEATQEVSTLKTRGRLLRVERAVPGEYIVVFHETPELAAQSVSATASTLAAAHGGKVVMTYGHALRGYWSKMTEAEAQALAADPRVKYVQENGFVSINATQLGATWGLDRVDQRDLPLNSNYVYNARGTGVHAYIIDTGVYQTHQEFTGRIGNGYDQVTPGGSATDCNGHGTHVAATVGGTTYGVAKNVTLHPVRVLDCQGSGTEAGVIAGVDWVTANKQTPAVANMSLGGDPNQALDDAVTRSINAGITYAIAAGNDTTDACSFSPARTPAAITVGASNKTDSVAWFSNYGSCVDIIAPGEDVTSAWNTSNSATNTISGTSMATPHVVGAAALYLERNPTATPQQVRDALVNNGTPGKLSSVIPGTPNVLLYTGFIPPATGGDTTAPTAAVTAPTAGATVVGNVTLSASASDNVGVTRVDFEVDGVAAGSDSTAPYSISWASASVDNGSHTIVARSWDAAGNFGTSASVTITVNNPGAATYDPVLKAPKCGSAGALCTTGSGMVKGRGVMGPELNAPNTINNSCADGNSGTYLDDESLESLKVYTTDGTNFAAGKTVTVEAKAWVYSTVYDAVDLYYAADATNPVWTYITTLTPSAAGLQTFTATYTLPTGNLQAIRGSFRFFGGPSPCTVGGSYDDRDDLIFTVGAGGGGGGGGTTDTTKPVTSITAPASGATLSGTVTVSASASDNVGVTKVEFYAGSTLIGTDTTAPYSVSWNTASGANSPYSLTSKAYDAAGNVGTSAAVSVTVSNGTGGSCSLTEQLLANAGFESGNVNWTASSGVIASSASTARSGSWRALLAGQGYYGTYSLYQQVTIPSTACSATLKFWLKITSDEVAVNTAYDLLSVEVQNTSGTVLGTLASYSNLSKGTSYVERTFDLAAYKGQTIRLVFNGSEDVSYQTSFFVDDASVTVVR